jgi:hypothetical protein
MSNDLNDWTNLQGFWRERSDERETLEHFRTLAAREKKRLQYEIAAEAALSIVSAAIFVWWATDARGFGRVMLLALSAFAIAMPAVTALVRRSVWRAQADTAESYRNFLRRRALLTCGSTRDSYIGSRRHRHHCRGVSRICRGVRVVAAGGAQMATRTRTTRCLQE